jgi:BON domain-containing protein
MSDLQSAPDDRPNVGSEPFEDELRAIEGEEPADEQDGALELDEVATPPEPTASDLDYGTGVTADPGAWEERAGSGDVVSLDALVDDDLREGETDNPLVAIEEGMTYVAPSDPPVVPSDDPEGVDIPGSADTDGAESDINARIREAIRADGATSALADRVEIAVIGSTVILRGVVDDLADGDDLVAVVEQVEGIDEVRDETEVAGLG